MSHKSFHGSLTKAFKGKGVNKEPVEIDKVLKELAKDVRLITKCVQKYIDEEKFLQDIVHFIPTFSDKKTSNAAIGRAAQFKLPPEVKNHDINGKSGYSRYERMMQGRLVDETLSWNERCFAAQNTSDKYISQGWKRTADASRPKNIKPMMNLAHAGDNMYVKFLHDPISQRLPYFDLELVIQGHWHTLRFKFDYARFKDGAKVCLPNVFLNDKGKPVFSFPVEYTTQYLPVSPRYVVGIDVGVIFPVMVVVRDVVTNTTQHVTSLSRRVASLDKSIKASNRQKNSLFSKDRFEESVLHRKAASRKKQEIAKIIGQEVANLSLEWDNALVAIEDLSFVRNTATYSRWNRGEIVKWIEHYVNLNGGRALSVYAGYTSQDCNHCGVRGLCNERDFICQNPQCFVFQEVQDRDINAAGNIAQRLEVSGVKEKIIKTRNEGAKRARVLKKPKKKHVKHSPETRQSLKYPGRDRTKTSPTPKRVKAKREDVVNVRERIAKIKEVKELNNRSTAGTIVCTVSADGEIVNNFFRTRKELLDCNEKTKHVNYMRYAKVACSLKL